MESLRFPINRDGTEQFRINSNEYTVPGGSRVAYGGSCLVYYAQKEIPGLNVKKTYVIKEFYPSCMEGQKISRDPDGFLVFPEDKTLDQRSIEVYQERFFRSWKTTFTLRENMPLYIADICEDDCIWFSEKKGLVAGGEGSNDSQRLRYIVMDYDSYAETMDKKMGSEQGLPVADFFEYCKLTATGLRELHKNGYYHMDLTPWNLFLYELAEGHKNIRFIDVDSFVKKDLVADFNFSSTEGFSAPEIRRIFRYGIDRQLLETIRQYGDQSDLFSMGCIIYWGLFLKGYDYRKPELSEIKKVLREKDPKLRGRALSDLSEKIYALLSRLLDAACCPKRKGRPCPRGSVQQCIDDISSICSIFRTAHERRCFTNKYAITPITGGRAGADAGTYIRRGDLLDRMEEAFREDGFPEEMPNSKHILFLSGMGGAGKSELARAYAYEHQEDYLDIFWLTCTDGETPVLKDLMAAAYRGVSEEDVQSFDREVLVILDNYNTDDYLFMNEIENATGDADIIITTKLAQIGEYSNIPVVSDRPEEFAQEVFGQNYTKALAGRRPGESLEDEASSIKEICERLQYNTKLVAMVGRRLGKYSAPKISECAEKLRTGLALVPGAINHGRDGAQRRDDLVGILRSLFKDILNYRFSEEEKKLISLLSLYPGVLFEQQFVFKLLGGFDTVYQEDAADTLLDLGWLEGNGEKITIHPLIAEAIREEEKDNPGRIIITGKDFYKNLIESFLAFPREELGANRSLIYKAYKKADLPDSNLKLAIGTLLDAPETRSIIGVLYPKILSTYFAYVDKLGFRKYVMVSLKDKNRNQETNVKTLYKCKLKDNGDEAVTLLKFYGSKGHFSLDLSEPVEGVGVTEIPEFFCYNNNGITDIKFPKNVKSIKEYAFAKCCGLKGKLDLPESLTVIEKSAFEECNFDGELHLPKSLVIIGDGAFHGCSGFTGNLCLPEGLTEIGDEAFSGCSGFTGSLSLPEGLTKIGAKAFSGCSGFTGELRLPDSLTKIGYSAFSGCSGFTGSLSLPERLIEIGHAAFSDCSGFTGSLSLPERLIEIGHAAFSGCSGFTGELRLPEGLTKIGEAAFFGCSGFTGNLRLPERMTEIGAMAFFGCSGFTGSLSLPEGLTKIGTDAFSGCVGLFDFSLYDAREIGLNQDGKGVYFYTYIRNDEELRLPEDLVTIKKRSFFGCKWFKGNLRLPEGLTEIGDEAFFGCSGFTGELHLPEGLTEMGEGAFGCCRGFTGELRLPEGLTKIGEGGFFNCKGFTGNLCLPERITAIGAAAFFGCSGFTGELYLPEKLTEIGAEAFSGCSGFTGELHLPEGLAEIGDEAFKKCSNIIGEVVLPKTLSSIGVEAFAYCEHITKITFLNPDTKINLILGTGKLMIIGGYRGSTAETYALENGLIFDVL